jgi:hypothetical protein
MLVLQGGSVLKIQVGKTSSLFANREHFPIFVS